MKEETHVQTAFRLPESMIKRMDKLAERMSEPGRKVTRADVLRLSAFRGLEQLEEAEGKKKR